MPYLPFLEWNHLDMGLVARRHRRRRQLALSLVCFCEPVLETLPHLLLSTLLAI